MQYGDMRSKFLGLLNRDDCTDDQAKTFFDLSIARCQRDLRLPHMERELDIDTSTGAVSEVVIPDDWLETISFIVGDDEIRYQEIGRFVRSKPVDPLHYTRKRGSWLVRGDIPQGTDAYVIYYGEEEPLVADTDETTLATIAPDLIIYGALTYAADHFIDDRGPGWEQKYQFFKGQLDDQASDGEDRNGSNQVEPAYRLEDGA